MLGFLVWGHHMFVAGQSIYAATVFSILSMLVAIPSAIKVFNWTATLYKGSISYQTPMLYALGFIGLFTIGGLTGVMLATLGIDVHVHDTYFIVAHFHYIMVGGTIMGYLGGLHYWWPKITGRLYPGFLSRLSALLVFVGFNLTFFPQFILGYLGMPRRYWSYPRRVPGAQRAVHGGRVDPRRRLHAAARLLRLVDALRQARPDNPWGAVGLEWETPSPPPTRELRDPAGRHPRPVRVRPRRGARAHERRHALSSVGWSPHGRTSPPGAAAPLRQPRAAEGVLDASGMWLFLVTEIMFFGGLFLAYVVYRPALPRGLRRREQPRSRLVARRPQHRGA